MHSQVSEDEFNGIFICPTCEKMFKQVKNVELSSLTPNAPTADEIDPGNESRKKKSRVNQNSKGLDMMCHEPPSDSTWIPKSDQDPDFAFTPSIKTAKLKAILLASFQEAPLDKVSQILLKGCHY